MSQYDRMMSGKLYNSEQKDDKLKQMYKNRIKFLNKFNATDFGDFKKREKLIRKYFKSAGKN